MTIFSVTKEVQYSIGPQNDLESDYFRDQTVLVTEQSQNKVEELCKANKELKRKKNFIVLPTISETHQKIDFYSSVQDNLKIADERLETRGLYLNRAISLDTNYAENGSIYGKINRTKNITKCLTTVAYEVQPLLLNN